MDKTFGVIMAGGGGTRFWPLSRTATPKQLLNLSGKDVMVNETIKRLNGVVDSNNIFIVTNETQVPKMAEVTEKLINTKNILSEPASRNTAACIGYSAVKILSSCGDGVMIVLPSDAFIKDEKEYQRVLRLAVTVAKNDNCIVTIGITPTFPATGYGYIQYGKDNNEVKNVIRFVEKPSLETAKNYLSEGNYAWNSGIFFFKASVILDNIKKFLPKLYDGLMVIKDSIGTKDEEKVLKEVYPLLESISIDYGVMEKADSIKVIPAEFGWNDVGSWDMMNVVKQEDSNGNILTGDIYLDNTTNSTIYAKEKTIAVVGLSNIVVVEADGAILVCDKSKAQDVKKIVDKLKENNRKDIL